MMKLPTNRATAANTSSRMLKNCRLLRMSDWFSLVIALPVRTSTPCGIWAWMRLASSSWLTDPSLLATTESTMPGWPTKACAVGVSNRANVAPAAVSASPNLATPTRGNCLLPPWDSTVTWSPSLNLPLSKLALSTISSLAPGSRPSAIRHVDRSPP